MRLPSLLAAFSVAAIALPPVASPQREARRVMTGREAFERLKRLEGDWSGTLEMNGRTSPLSATYRLVANGTTLVEDMGGMLTTYYLDGERLMLIHYCTAGNQPRMKARSLDERNIVFEIYDVSNLRGPDAYRSTSVDVNLISDDKIDLVYGGMSEGKPTPPQIYHLIRRR